MLHSRAPGLQCQILFAQQILQNSAHDVRLQEISQKGFAHSLLPKKKIVQAQVLLDVYEHQGMEALSQFRLPLLTWKESEELKAACRIEGPSGNRMLFLCRLIIFSDEDHSVKLP